MMKMLLLTKLGVVSSGGRVVRHPIKGENVPGKVKNFLQEIAEKASFRGRGPFLATLVALHVTPVSRSVSR